MLKKMCPCGSKEHGRHVVEFVELPKGYATKRWPEAVETGARKEEPYVQCPVCTSTFPKWAIEELD